MKNQELIFLSIEVTIFKIYFYTGGISKLNINYTLYLHMETSNYIRIYIDFIHIILLLEG